MQMKTFETKVFMNGSSQAIRIPKDLQLNSKSVYIRKNEKGELIISTHEAKWAEFLSFLRDNQNELSDFMVEREDLPLDDKELF